MNSACSTNARPNLLDQTSLVEQVWSSTAEHTKNDLVGWGVRLMNFCNILVLWMMTWSWIQMTGLKKSMTGLKPSIGQCSHVKSLFHLVCFVFVQLQVLTLWQILRETLHTKAVPIRTRRSDCWISMRCHFLSWVFSVKKIYFIIVFLSSHVADLGLLAVWWWAKACRADSAVLADPFEISTSRTSRCFLAWECKRISNWTFSANPWRPLWHIMLFDQPWGSLRAACATCETICVDDAQG